MNQIVILEKDGNYAAVARMEISEPGFDQAAGVVGIFDKRQRNPLWHSGFETAEKTNDAFKKAVRTSKEREWREVFRGKPINNPALS
jgi:hypothetical protein